MLGNLATFHPGSGQSQQDANRVRAKLQRDLADDDTFWHGWWGRHDYTLGYLGDAVAGNSGEDGRPLEFALLAAFTVLISSMLREMTAKPRRPAPVQAAKTAKARRGR
jgi:hypothetical protein